MTDLLSYFCAVIYNENTNYDRYDRYDGDLAPWDSEASRKTGGAWR